MKDIEMLKKATGDTMDNIHKLIPVLVGISTYIILILAIGNNRSKFSRLLNEEISMTLQNL